MQAYQRQTSIIEQPDGELIRAVLDPAISLDPEPGVQFDLGMLALKVAADTQPEDLPPAGEQKQLKSAGNADSGHSVRAETSIKMRMSTCSSS